MTDGKIFALIDPVAEALDDLAALGDLWAKNRERGRTPYAIKKAMVLVARDVLAIAEHDEMVAGLATQSRTTTGDDS